MSNDRRRCLRALAGLAASSALPAFAAELQGLAAIRQRGTLRVAVYNDFPPYSTDGSKGIDVDIGRALAERLGLKAEIVGFNADEDMNGDLRNMVWKGHYLGTRPADVMMHVPVDEVLARANDKVRIFGGYHRESLAIARNAERVQPLAGSAAVALEVFTREKIGVEGATLSDSFLLTVLNGRLRENVAHFKTIAEAVHALQRGEVAAVMGPRAEIEAALGEETRFPVEEPQLAELRRTGWLLGMAVKADDMELAEALGGAIADLKRDGSVAEIFRRNHISYLAG